MICIKSLWHARVRCWSFELYFWISHIPRTFYILSQWRIYLRFQVRVCQLIVMYTYDTRVRVVKRYTSWEDQHDDGEVDWKLKLRSIVNTQRTFCNPNIGRVLGDMINLSNLYQKSNHQLVKGRKEADGGVEESACGVEPQSHERKFLRESGRQRMCCHVTTTRELRKTSFSFCRLPRGGGRTKLYVVTGWRVFVAIHGRDI